MTVSVEVPRRRESAPCPTVTLGRPGPGEIFHIPAGGQRSRDDVNSAVAAGLSDGTGRSEHEVGLTVSVQI